jgi:proteic killer suppression protein
MLVILKTLDLEELYIMPVGNIKGKLPFQKSLIQRYKDRIVLLESIEKITDLHSYKSLHFEKLKGDKAGQSSIRLNDQYRLIIKEISSEVIKILIVEISKHYE